MSDSSKRSDPQRLERPSDTAAKMQSAWKALTVSVESDARSVGTDMTVEAT